MQQSFRYAVPVSVAALSSATTINVAAGPNVPQTDTVVALVPQTNEIISFTGTTGNNMSAGTLTGCVRGLGGSTAAAIPVGATIQCVERLQQILGVASLAAAIGSTTQTLITVTQTGPILPGEAPFQILVDSEIMQVTAVSVAQGDEPSGGLPGVVINLTVSRAAQSTTAATHANGAVIAYIPQPYT